VNYLTDKITIMQ